jgi:aminobenzoyl-glutamate transport protein
VTDTTAGDDRRTKGILGAIERFGNKLPDPVLIFLWLIIFVMALSVVGALMGWNALNPVSGKTITAQSLFSSENLNKLIVDMPKTLTGFAPLGYVLIVMLGAGVAERSGWFAAVMKAGVKDAPKGLLTPIVVFMGIMGNQAADAAYVVLIPLAGLLFAAAGRHPIAGIAAAFAGVSGGFSANLLPGQLDALLLGITEPAARLLVPTWTANIAGNWWFIAAMALVFTPVGWFVCDKIIEPRLGKWEAGPDTKIDLSAGELNDDEKKGLAIAGWAALAIALLWVALVVPHLWFALGATTAKSGPPLYDAACYAKFLLDQGVPATDELTKLMNGAGDATKACATGEQVQARALQPFYTSLIAGFFLMFLIAGVLYGQKVGTVKTHRDVIKMMSEAMADLGPYIVLAFMAAHFVAMFNWSNLGPIAAIHGAEGIKASGLPTPALLGLIVLLAATINLAIGSASAKWGMMAPVLVPMLMLLGVSPEMTTAAYRMGDSVTNIVTPLMVYFPLVLTFCQRWDPKFGMGSLMATMIPYSLWFLLFGMIMTVGWVYLNIPLGPGAIVGYELPTAAPAVPAPTR